MKRRVLAVAALGLTAFVLIVLFVQMPKPSYALSTYRGPITCQGGYVAPDVPYALVLHGRLEGNAAVVWANDATTVFWPVGYVARFEPGLVVYDVAGNIRGRDGEDISAGAGGWHGQHACYNRLELPNNQVGSPQVFVLVPTR